MINENINEAQELINEASKKLNEAIRSLGNQWDIYDVWLGVSYNSRHNEETTPVPGVREILVEEATILVRCDHEPSKGELLDLLIGLGYPVTGGKIFDSTKNPKQSKMIGRLIYNMPGEKR